MLSRIASHSGAGNNPVKAVEGAWPHDISPDGVYKREPYKMVNGSEIVRAKHYNSADAAVISTNPLE